MGNYCLRKDNVRKRVKKIFRNLSLRRLPVYLGIGLGAVLLAGMMLIFVFGNLILNGYGKGKVERMFAEAYPGYALRIGELDYAIGANRLVARSIMLEATNLTLKADQVSLTGVRWMRLLWGRKALPDSFDKAGLDATNLDMEFFQAHYGIRCARLRASVPGSDLTAEEINLQPLIGDEELFAASAFRTTRFRAVVPECRVSGLRYGELLQGKAYRAQSVQVSRPALDALVNRDKPEKPFVKSPLMPNEALAAIRIPLQIDNLSIGNGQVKYGERVVAGAEPGLLTITEANMHAEGISNREETSAAIRVRAQGKLMDTGELKVLLTIPVVSKDFSLDYSGSLGPMDVTRLNAFLDIAEHTRIKSGSASEATFDIHVTNGAARGRLRATYKDLKLAMLDKQTGTEKGWDNRLASFMANTFKIRNANAVNASGLMKEGEVVYKRKPDDTFLQFLWFALRSGALDVISH